MFFSLTEQKLVKKQTKKALASSYKCFLVDIRKHLWGFIAIGATAPALSYGR